MKEATSSEGRINELAEVGNRLPRIGLLALALDDASIVLAVAMSYTLGIAGGAAKTELGRGAQNKVAGC